MQDGYRRIILMSGVESLIANEIEELVRDFGYILIGVEALRANNSLVRILVDKINGVMNIKDCSVLDKILMPVIREMNFIDDDAVFEISSPGVERPLVFYQDFKQWQGYQVSVKLNRDGNKVRKYKGQLIDYNETGVVIKSDSQAESLKFLFTDIRQVKLVSTPELIDFLTKRSDKLNAES